MCEVYGEPVLGLLGAGILQRLLAAGYTDIAQLQQASFEELWAFGLPDAVSKQLDGPKLLRAAGAVLRGACLMRIHTVHSASSKWARIQHPDVSRPMRDCCADVQHTVVSAMSGWYFPCAGYEQLSRDMCPVPSHDSMVSDCRLRVHSGLFSMARFHADRHQSVLQRIQGRLRSTDSTAKVSCGACYCFQVIICIRTTHSRLHCWSRMAAAALHGCQPVEVRACVCSCGCHRCLSTEATQPRCSYAVHPACL